jgi:ADP-ribosyl-[dinitrogen reductase] hydrolase
MRMPPELLQVDFLPDAALKTHGRLGLTCAPGLWWRGRGLDSDLRLREDLTELAQAHGAKMLVTLLEQSELDELGDLGREARVAGLTWVHFPIPDMWVPRDVAATRKLVRRMLRALEAGDDVVVHCWAGLGRAGTIAAACLVSRGMAPALAMQTVRKARDGAIQSEAQEQFVLGFTRKVRR